MSGDGVACVALAQEAGERAKREVIRLDSVLAERAKYRRDATAMVLTLGRAESELDSLEAMLDDVVLSLASVSAGIAALRKEIQERTAEVVL